MALPQSRVLPEVGYPVASGDTTMPDEYRATPSKAALQVWAGRLLWVWMVGAGRPTAPDVAAELRAELTPQEQQLLEGLAAGDSNKQLAERLRLTDGTIRNYLSGLYAKLGVRSRTEALAWWMRTGKAGVRG